MKRSLLSLFCASLFWASHAQAQGFDDLFGDSLSKAKSSNLDAVKKASQDIKAKSATGLTLKEGQKTDKTINFESLFAAEKIKISRKEGCIPADYGRTKLVLFEFDEMPNTSVPFQVCITMTSSIGREVPMSARIIDPRNKRAGSVKSIVDFRGTKKANHIVEFPKLRFENPGQYKYVIEIEDKVVATFDIFTVAIDDS